MNGYQKALQVLEKEHQVTCEAAGIEETARAKAYFQLLGNFMDKETPKKPIDIEFGPCGDLMLCCPTCEHGVVPIPTYHGNKYYPRCPFCGQKLKEEKPQETNLDHYKYNIVEHFMDDLAMADKKIRTCQTTSCSDCEFSKENGECIGKSKIRKWLDQPYKKPTYKLTQCEYDMLDTIFEKEARFSTVYLIGELKKKGYFENIKCDSKVLVKDILANCEVIQ